MRYLIWTLAFGERSRQLAPIWLDAVQRVGKWRHDIVMLGDHHIADIAGPRLRVFDIYSDVNTRFGMRHRDWTHWTINNLKGQISHYTDLKRYRYILYLDLDVLVNQDRLEAVVESK